MTNEEFWDLITSIDSSRLDALEEDEYPEDDLKPLVSKLAELDIKEIEDFEEKLSFFLYSLDGEKYADHAGESGNSGDGFLYARCWVVAKGKRAYEEVLHNPEKMPKELRHWCEPLLYVSAEAWAIKTGNDEADWDYFPKYSYETGSNSACWTPIESNTVESTPADLEFQKELEYKRALSSVRHLYNAGRYKTVVDRLEPFAERLSAKFKKLLQDAKDKLPNMG